MRHALVALLLFAAGALAYANSLTNPFVFDDLPAIVGNRDIRQIWPPIWLDSPWHGSLASRPVVMCSLALSYAINGVNPLSFRIANLLMHIGCSLLFYAIAHRLLRSTSLRSTYCNAGQALALICALVWLLHPIQSQCINYLNQGSQILMTLCALTVLCAAQRSTADTGWWSVLAVAACILGMASKESMVAVPLLAPLCDRAMSGDHMIWRQRLVFYLSLAASWLPLF